MKVTTDACLFGAWAAAAISVQQTTPANPAHGGVPRLLDIGTGTGLLSLMVAQKTTVAITALEIDPEAASQAVENIAASVFTDRISVIEADLRRWNTEQRFAFIVCNPPFYENNVKSGNKAKDRAHHSEDLLLADLIWFVQKALTENGSFYLLLPATRLTDLTELFQAAGLYIGHLCRVQQTTRHPPFRIMVQCSRTRLPAITQTLSIKDENNQYTPAFTAMLKEYYLYL